MEAPDSITTKVLSGHEEKNGDIHVTFLIAEGDYINQKGHGYASSLLKKWHGDRSWIGLVHNVHESRNHPLVYAKPPKGLTESGLVKFYKNVSEQYGIGKFVATKLKDLGNGAVRLLGVVKLFRTAKEMWKKGKFPLYSSSSTYATKEKGGLVTDGIPISNTSVDKPAYGIELAKSHGECEGGEECVTKLLEASETELCGKTINILSSFENNFSSNSKEKLQESSMGNEEGSSTDNAEVKHAVDGETTTISAETKGKEVTGSENENVEELREFKKKYLEMEPQFKEYKKKSKEADDYKIETDKRLAKIETEKVEGKIRNVIEKIPLVIFENKEDNREEEIKNAMKLYGKLNEEELLGFVKEKFKLSAKVIEVSNKKSGLKESGFISNNAPARGDGEKKSSVSILDAHKLIGGE